MHLDNIGIRGVTKTQKYILNGCTTNGQWEVASNMTIIVLYVMNIVQSLRNH